MLYDRCTSRTRLPTHVLRVPTKYLTTTMSKSAFIRGKNFVGKIPDLSVFVAEPGGRWPPYHVNNEVGVANYLVV